MRWLALMLVRVVVVVVVEATVVTFDISNVYESEGAICLSYH